MKCEAALPLINSLVDREIVEVDRNALEGHLSSCSECRATMNAVRLADAELNLAFQPDREAARQVADNVIRLLEPETIPAQHGVTDDRRVDWRSLALALVAGFLLALIIFPPSSHQPRPEQHAPIVKSVSPSLKRFETLEPEDQKQPARVAKLVAWTGDVQLDSGDGDWNAVSLNAFRCPSDSRIRTSKGAVCELLTSDGAVIRMNGETEVKLRSPLEIELQKGQVFCQTPDDASIEVYSSESSASELLPQKNAWSACGSGTGFLATLSTKGEGSVTSWPGCSVDVRTESSQHRLKPGESANIVNGKVEQSGPAYDALIVASWIHPLLMQKGHDDPELNRRVDELLARIGHSKMSMLYEREIRSLGEYCVLPLIRYVQSPISQHEPGRRANAMSIAADLAPTVLIGELLPLLRDDSPEIRFQTAQALLRLTKETHGRRPAEWRKPIDETTMTADRWTTWWQLNRDRYPAFKTTRSR